jgi:hypothetical protein
MFTLDTAVTTPQGEGVITGLGTTARGDGAVVVDIAGRIVRFTGSDLYHIETRSTP